MKKLGLVGGMGPESTIPYYHDIVYGVQKRIGKNLFPNLVIESVNVFDVLRLCDEQKYDELTNYLIQAIQNLILCCQREHAVFLFLILIITKKAQRRRILRIQMRRGTRKWMRSG